MLRFQVAAHPERVGGYVDLAGKYRLIAELGQGGMATVYLAVALGTSGFRKLAVVKLIRPQYASDPDLIEMFLDEARLCARLSHPNIVQTYDVGVDEGQHLMAMEYLDGVSFNAAISRLGREGGPLTFPLRARVVLDVLEGLRYAHDLKDYDGKPLSIVHRDVTPHNIFVTYDGQVKLLDFGIAKAATSSVQTATGVIKGKLTYMAPEQAFGDPVDARADLYAVGVMLWEALTGRRRFPVGLSDAAMFTRVASGEMPEAPNAAALGYPAEIDDLVLKALAPKREDRFQNAGEMHAALDAALRKAPPVSLRELGTLLTESFVQERVRIRQVIEEQFRRMDSTAPAQAVANVNSALPTVHPPRGTDSLIRDRQSPGPMPSLDSEDIAVPIESSTTRGLSTMTSRIPDAKPQRVRLVLAGVLAASAVAAIAALGPRMWRPHAETGAATQLGPTTDTASHTAERIVPKPVLEEDPPSGASSAAMVRPEESHREESSAGVSKVAAGRHEHFRPGSTLREPTEPLASPDGGASVVAPTDTALRHPTTKPKVQLDPDNPWP